MSAVCNQNCIKINSGMIEIEYEVKEDMYVSCVDPSLDPELPGC